jgi:hypothetical protein
VDLLSLPPSFSVSHATVPDGDLMLSVDDETDNGMTLISSAGIDLEIVTEDLAIKTHELIWKTEEKGLEEELKMLESEKASHMKVSSSFFSLLLRVLGRNCEEHKVRTILGFSATSPASGRDTSSRACWEGVASARSGKR